MPHSKPQQSSAALPDVSPVVSTPELNTLLAAGMGVVIVPDTADFPDDSLLLVKQSAARAILTLAAEIVGQVAAPFLLMIALCVWCA